MTDRLQLLRGLATARANDTLAEFIEGLTHEQFELISPNMKGATAHRVSGTLVTSLDHQEVLRDSTLHVNNDHFNAFRSWQESLGKLPRESLDNIDDLSLIHI